MIMTEIGENITKKEEKIEKIDVESKKTLMARIEKFEKIYKNTKDEEVKSEIDEMKLELKLITDFELKNYPLIEQIAIMDESNVAEQDINKNIISQIFKTDINEMEYETNADWFKRHGMRLDPEHGVLVGAEAIYGVEGCKNPWRQNA